MLADRTETRIGRQTPTAAVVLPYRHTHGAQAVDLYAQTGRTAQEWQANLLYDMLAVDDGGLFVHTKWGYSVPRRNGKNEVVAIRELWGLMHGEHILHTAHRTTTSSSAAQRLARFLNDMGWQEVQRVKKDEDYAQHYMFSKQFGLEKITLLDGSEGTASFRTRTSKGGLGEGFDLLIIDEAQEYQDDQESSLKYVVSDSKNPQTILCGTPPTAVSTGTVFQKYREQVLFGESENSGWAEWSVEKQSDVHDRALWYECNPSMGTILTERKVLDEIGTDEVDFNIQRLGLWLAYNQKSAITENEWLALRPAKLPPLVGKLYAGVKYGTDGENVSLSIAVHIDEGKGERIFVEAIDCRPVRDGNAWLAAFFKNCKGLGGVVVDGASGQQLLAAEMHDAGIRKKPIFPTVKEIIAANAAFEAAVFGDGLRHMGQPSLTQAVTNSEKRSIGTSGGFGYRSCREGVDISLMDSAILAFWLCSQNKAKKRQQIRY
jgi:hypothetical protein